MSLYDWVISKRILFIQLMMTVFIFFLKKKARGRAGGDRKVGELLCNTGHYLINKQAPPPSGHLLSIRQLQGLT